MGFFSDYLNFPLKCLGWIRLTAMYILKEMFNIISNENVKFKLQRIYSTREVLSKLCCHRVKYPNTNRLS